MQIKNLTLGLSLLLTGSALAQTKTHVVKPGETVAGIAAMFNSRAEAILRANGLPKNAYLTAGHTIVVPNATIFLTKQYKVRNGDCDWTIAHKFSTSVHKLHLANPEVRDWDALRNGLALNIPGSSQSVSVAQNKPAKQIAHPRTVATRPFVVTEDDNDWVIAHHLGVSLSLIHELNPGVNWNRLRAGKHILVPANDGSSGTRVAKSGKSGGVKINRIHTRYAVVNSDSVSIRRAAGSHARKITTVDTGTRVVVLDRDGAWYKLRFPHGTEGWVRGDYLNPSKVRPSSRHHSSESRVASRRRRHHGHTKESIVALDTETKKDPLIKTAVAMRGTRYSYGSSSRSATDCSGFTWQVYGKQGIHLPRTSNEQSHVGQAIKSNDLKPGDLVFFSTRGSRRVGHVGMYVGKGKFIHASSGGGKVQFNSLSDAYYQNHYKGARRVIKPSKSKAKHETPKAQPPKASGGEDTNPTPITK